MLANYLRQLRKNRILQPGQIQLCASWKQTDSATIEKTYSFADYQEAANFINRYTDHCASLNFLPEWSNMANKVSVRIRNYEFNALTTKEVSLAQQLDRVSRQTLHQDIEDVLSFAQVVEQAKLDSNSIVND